jgi:hypothetical protein
MEVAVFGILREGITLFEHKPKQQKSVGDGDVNIT